MDAIDLEVIFQSTQQIARELTMNMLRTGYSTSIKETQDFTFAVLDSQARMVAQGIPQPVHIGPISAQVKEIHRLFGSTAEPGDSFIVNHPYKASQNHAADITVVSPVFYDGRLAAYIGNTAHKPDIGGKVPGSNSADATELFQEGLLIPPIRFARNNEVDQSIAELIQANTRTPEVTWGDCNAQLRTNIYGVSKFSDLFARYGLDAVLACWERWMDICETELRKAISQLRPGIYGPVTDYLDDDGIDRDKPCRLSASVEVRADSLHFILDSDPQVRGPLNLRPCVPQSVIECWVKMALGPQIPVNDGLSRVVSIAYPPEGSLLNPRFPAPVNMYTRPAVLLSSIISRVLGLVMPGRIPAPSSAAGGGITIGGLNPRTNRWFSIHEIYNGGTGGGPFRDGVSCMDDLSINVMNTPIEAVETEFPLRIRRYELVSDSGGPGTYRGGLGAIREWQVECDEVRFNLRSERFKFSSPGVMNAKPAQPSGASLNPGTPTARPLESKVANCRLRRGEVVSWHLAGGGGYGDPLKRDPELVLRDVLCGYVSEDKAREDYGVVFLLGLAGIDRESTAKLRGEVVPS